MLIVISGPSGVGKNRLLRHAQRALDLQTVVPMTTRPPRPDESNGQDYWFITREEFRARVRSRAFTVWDYAVNNYYGYPNELRNRMDRHEPTIIHSLGRMAVRLSSIFEDVVLVYLDSSDDELLRSRLISRSAVTSEEMVLREAHWREEREHSSMFDLVIRDGDTAPLNEMLTALGSIIGRLPGPG